MKINDRVVPAAAFTLVEIIFALAIMAILALLITVASQRVRKAASMAVSANNVRQLAIGAVAYLGDNNQTFWRYRETVTSPEPGVRWWYGFETQASQMKTAEGERWFDEKDSPIGPYIPNGTMVDPSFAFTGKPFKPKYRSGYMGFGYNLFLAGSTGNSAPIWLGAGTPRRFGQLKRPDQIVMFATCAQVNTMQQPASYSNPMIEEFYAIDESYVTVHGRHNGRAMVAYATGNVGFLPIDPKTIDPRAPDAQIGRFAPQGDTKYLVDPD